jgi:hypothetical protein
VFLEAALVFSAFAAGFEGLAAGFAFPAVLEADFAVFTGLEEVDFFATTVLDFDALLAPASRVAFFGAAGAFATWSSRRKAFPGITKTHVKSDKSV